MSSSESGPVADAAGQSNVVEDAAVAADVDDEDCVGAAVTPTVVVGLGRIFRGRPGLTLKSLPSLSLHVFRVWLPHQNSVGLLAPVPSPHGYMFDQ